MDIIPNYKKLSGVYLISKPESLQVKFGALDKIARGLFMA